MVALNFSPEFADDVEAGRKTQTIRQTARVKPGQRIQLYTGQRTKACRKLGEAICASVASVELRRDFAVIDGIVLVPASLEILATDDGFQDYAAMWGWFSKKYQVPQAFYGRIIRWKKEEPTP